MVILSVTVRDMSEVLLKVHMIALMVAMVTS